MNIGLFGGTFDPPHTGHLIVAQDAALALGLDRILFIPAAQPPHKDGASVSPAHLRAEMLRLALAGDDRFALDPLELERAGPSWTVDTLRVLHERQPSVRWTLFMGTDQYAEFGTWREPDEIRRLARIAVLSRLGELVGPAPGTAARQAAGMPGAAAVAGPAGEAAAVRAGVAAEAGIPGVAALDAGDVAVDVLRIDVSSTLVRRRVAAGLSIRYLVPPAVESFIFEHGLYGRNGQVATG